MRNDPLPRFGGEADSSDNHCLSAKHEERFSNRVLICDQNEQVAAPEDFPSVTKADGGGAVVPKGSD